MPDIHIAAPLPTADECDSMKLRIEAFMFPNVASTPEEIAAVNRAVAFQIAHEKTIASQCGDNAIPQGTQSFKIGDFSMTFSSDAMSGALTSKTICPYAYGALLRAGLLYRGVERV